MQALNAACGASVYTVPRLMTLSDDGMRLLLKPLPALAHLRSGPSTEVTVSTADLLAAGGTNASFTASVAHINVLLPCSLTTKASFFGVHVLTGGGETTLIGWDTVLGRISLDRGHSSSNLTGGQDVRYTGALEGVRSQAIKAIYDRIFLSEIDCLWIAGLPSRGGAKHDCARGWWDD